MEKLHTIRKKFQEPGNGKNPETVLDQVGEIRYTMLFIPENTAGFKNNPGRSNRIHNKKQW